MNKRYLLNHFRVTLFLAASAPPTNVLFSLKISLNLASGCSTGSFSYRPFLLSLYSSMIPFDNSATCIMISGEYLQPSISTLKNTWARLLIID